MSRRVPQPKPADIVKPPPPAPPVRRSIACTCFDVPALPKSVNDWRRGTGHWSIAAAERKRMALAVAVAKVQQGVTPIPGPVHVALTFYWPDRRKRDPDNGAKHVLDAIVEAQLIEDDGPPVLVSLTLAARYDAERPRTEVKITAAGDYAWALSRQSARRKGRTAA